MKAEVKSMKKVEIKKPDHEAFLPGEVGAVLELTVRKKDGTIREHRVMKSKSFVRQFFDLLLVQMQLVTEVAPMAVKDITGTTRYLAFSGELFGCNALIGDDTFGIVAGTGTTSPTINDYSLETKIAEGTGAGQLQHGNVAYGLPTASGSISHFTITRDLSNGSGAEITVNELGLYVKAREAQFHVYRREALLQIFMTIRDVISGGIAVPNGDTLTVNYRLQATV